MNRIIAFLPLVAIALSSCSAPVDDADSPASVSAAQVPAPLVQKADSQDVADHGCLVVLRQVQRSPGPTGYEIQCTSERCWFVWSGTIDVARSLVEQGATVGLMYQVGMGEWWEVPAEATESDDGPMQSFAFRFFDHAVDTSLSLTALAQARVQVIPVVHLPGGGRLFDHNRVSSDLDNYVLNYGNDWSVNDDDSVCTVGAPTASTLEFLAGWKHVQHGTIVEGGTLTIQYDLARLPDCRGTHNGYPAWDTTAFARFMPMGELHQGSVRAFESNQGIPTTKAHGIPITFDVPKGATSVQLWFRNASGAGMSCETWDSNLEANYVFAVQRFAPSPVKWAGDWGNGFSRECEHRDGIEEPTVIDSWIMQRACMFVDADVYVPGLTDVDADPAGIVAQVNYGFDDQDPVAGWLTYQGRVGNNYRYRWELPRDVLQQSSWDKITYRFRFSTDGLNWYTIGQAQGPEGGDARTLLRSF
ncbi:MAG TPA: DUF6209 family protein [Polyangiaceae bacterium]|nr:MAG: hypothetical protein BWY17_02132 [Deltaproteobacteria bacterium ADurb.Bin207]HNS99689.1 DUF6209 family protein [Polyangiaceae bacterium]HNZ22370.1 DUF6209 family protein [Polyangiaceae bacterium]HOD20904.1 DUF6209 family protein [Polyangiaceae bacterium]HOE51777.1 DUF6209 family protein [Polyangiaceae bacterium]